MSRQLPRLLITSLFICRIFSLTAVRKFRYTNIYKEIFCQETKITAIHSDVKITGVYTKPTFREMNSATQIYRNHVWTLHWHKSSKYSPFLCASRQQLSVTLSETLYFLKALSIAEYFLLKIHCSVLWFQGQDILNRTSSKCLQRNSFFFWCIT